MITDKMIDRAAKFLRETNQSHQQLTPWEDTPKATKKKWLVLAKGALEAAFSDSDAKLSESK